jgi:uncharacterized protein YgiM (DUF1202 family)
VKAVGLLLTLLATHALAATAYVTDELVLGVYATQTTQGQRLATLHSGAVVETLTTNGDATQVRLQDGTTGWVKSAYLTNIEPATTRIKQMQDELDRTRATTPALAEAAERSEVERLTRELAAAQQSAAAQPTPGSGAAPAPSAPVRSEMHLWQWVAAVCAALGLGFWLGYAALARRIKAKFGGIKVY